MKSNESVELSPYHWSGGNYEAWVRVSSPISAVSHGISITVPSSAMILKRTVRNTLGPGKGEDGKWETSKILGRKLRKGRGI